MKDLINSNVLNANEKKQGWLNSGSNMHYFVQYFKRHCLFYEAVAFGNWFVII